MKRSGVARLLMAAGVAVSAASAARGQTTLSWIAAGDGFWGFSGNWSPVGIPDSANEIALLGQAIPYTVNVNNSYTIRGVSITNPQATLLISAIPGSVRSLSLDAGGLSNDGLVRLEGSPSTGGTTLTFTAPTTIAGAGEIRLEEADVAEVILSLPSGQALTVAPLQRITGTGVIRASSSNRLINQGEIRGDRAGGVRITTAVESTGLIHAVPGGGLQLAGSLTQTGAGELRADGADVALQSGANITGGVVRGINGGVFRAVGSTTSWTALRFDGEMILTPTTSSNGSLTITGTGIENDGRIVVREDLATSLSSTLTLQSPAVLSGHGEVVLDESGDPNINTTGSGQVLNGPEHTIRGSGTIGGNSRLMNEGEIRGDIPGGLTFQSITVDNRARIRAVPPGSVTMAATLLQNLGAGVLEADGADVLLQGTVTGGTVRGVNGGRVVVNSNATVNGGAVCEGDWSLLPGPSTVTLTIGAGGVTNNGLIRLRADNTTTQNVRVQMNERVTLGGSGEVRLEEADDAELNINLASGLSATNGAGHTISGTGSIVGASTARLINLGLIEADLPGGMLISLPVDNRSLIRASGDGQLRLSNLAVTQTSAGVLEADDAEIVLPNSASVTGGTVRGVNGGTVRITGAATVNGVTAAGEWRVEPALTAAAIQVGTLGLINNGLIRLVSNPFSPQDARLQIDELTPILGAGELRLEEPVDTELFLDLGAGFIITNGPLHRISGVGRIGGAGAGLRNEGVLAPGLETPGTLVVAAPLTMGSSSVLEIGMAGPSLLQRDVLEVSGAALAGTLRVRMEGGFVMPACQRLEVVRGPVTGEFETLELDRMPQGVLAVEYSPDGVAVSYTPGDLTGDALLDHSDYLEFLNLYNEFDPAADFTGDGVVDFGDVLEFFNLYETGC